jgi:hypothetical protein
VIVNKSMLPLRRAADASALRAQYLGMMQGSGAKGGSPLLPGQSLMMRWSTPISPYTDSENRLVYAGDVDGSAW